jgi:hypothetical protein
MLLLLRECKSGKDRQTEIDRLNQTNALLTGNMAVLKDTVKFWKDETGHSLSSISILTANKEMLETQFKDLGKKYDQLIGKESNNSKMIAYLNGQISFRDRQISDLQAASSAGTGNKIINDSTIAININKQYDSLNSYSVTGLVQTSIKNNKITAGKVDLTTAVNMGIEVAISRDKTTSIAKVTTRTAFPAKIVLKGITEIENEINKKPKAYLGLGVFAGYGATIQKQPTITPILGLGVYYAPSWSTIKFYKK